jgi:hypothetical protein
VSVSVTPSIVTETSFCCAHVRYNLEQRVFIYDCYVREKNLYKSCRRKFRLKFPDTTCPADTISKLVNKVRIHRIFIDRNLLKRNHFFNWGKTSWRRPSIRKFSEIFAAISTTKWCFSKHWINSVSLNIGLTATELLHIRPYKITIVSEIKPVDYKKKSEIL